MLIFLNVSFPEIKTAGLNLFNSYVLKIGLLSTKLRKGILIDMGNKSDL
jgi:hypothetical protein